MLSSFNVIRHYLMMYLIVTTVSCAPDVPNRICTDDGDCPSSEWCNARGLCSASARGNQPDVEDRFELDSLGDGLPSDVDAVEAGDNAAGDNADFEDSVDDLDVGPDTTETGDLADADMSLAPPQNLEVNINDAVAILSWEAVASADGYNLYWATTTGVTPENYMSLSGYRVADVSSPAQLDDLERGVRIYAVVTAFRGDLESAPSNEASALRPHLTTVEPLFPDNGDDWNDYVIPDGSACVGTEVGLDGCLHAGERRIAIVPGLENCDAVTAGDSLGAFIWSCVENENIAVVSQGLADNATLSDLIDFSAAAWKENTLTVFLDGSAYAESDADAWWDNEITIDVDGGSLASDGTIYIVTDDAEPETDITGDGFVFDDSNIALLVEPGRTFATDSALHTVRTNGQDFLWLEGTVAAQIDRSALEVVGTSFSVFRSFTATSGYYGVVLIDSHNNRFRDIWIWGGFITGFLVNDSTDTEIVRLMTGAAEMRAIDLVNVERFQMSDIAWVLTPSMGGLRLETSSNCTIENARAVGGQSDSEGVFLSGSSDNVLVNVFVANGLMTGIYISGGSVNNVLLNSTVVNSELQGIYVYREDTTDNLLMNALSINNGSGVTVTRSARTTFVNLATASSANIDVLLNEAVDSTFSGLLKVETGCSVTDGTNPGLIDGTCTDTGEQGSSTYLGQTSDAVLSTGVSVSNTLVGRWFSDDPINPDDNNGYVADSADLTMPGWFDFDRLNRGWGQDSEETFPHDSQQVACTGTEVACRIWDFNPIEGDDGDAGGPVILGVLEIPSSAGDVYTHTWSATNEDDCLALTPGIWTGSTCNTTFLINAVELFDDDVGNDNGLCESHEDCLFTPNIGTYQGHGEPILVPDFYGAGTINNVTLYTYQEQGCPTE